MEAAHALFLGRGYGVTTIEAISDAADVPPATVYRLFSSKHGILKALLDVSIVGDDDAVPMVDRPQVQSVLAVGDPREKIAGFVKVTAEVNDRIAPLYRILLSAAGTDPDAGALLDRLTQQRRQGQRVIARSLAGVGSLRAGIGEREAGDVIHALMSPEVYRLLVIDRGWKTERYERWLTNTLIDQLLPPPAADKVGRREERSSTKIQRAGRLA